MLYKIGLQTFTIRQNIRTPDKLEHTLAFYASKGISNFELAKIKFNSKELNILKALQINCGIRYSACQITLKKIIKNFEFLIDFCSKLNIKYLEVSVIPFMHFIKGKKGILELGRILNELGKKTGQKGIMLLYHHHNFELIKFNNDISLDVLIENTNMEYVNFVCDTYWLARSGYNPVKFTEDRIHRIKGIHLRDNLFEFKKGRFRSTDGALGEGTIDFYSILKPAINKKIDFYSIEQDTNNPEADIMKSLSHIKYITGQ